MLAITIEELTNDIFKLKSDLCDVLKLDDINDIDNSSENISKVKKLYIGYQSEIEEIKTRYQLFEKIFSKCPCSQIHLNEELYQSKDFKKNILM